MRQAGWIALVMVFGVSGMAAPQKTSADMVKMNVTAEKPAADGTQVIKITLDIEKDWHLYANPVQNLGFEANATKVLITDGKDELKGVKVEYPKGTFVNDKMLMEDYFIYKDKVEIKAIVKRPSGTPPLKVLVEVSACDKSTCLKRDVVGKTVD